MTRIGKSYTFLSNNFKLVAKTMADIYKARWQIELFFKWVKRNLKIKSLAGTSKNAVMTQIWIALCAYLILVRIKLLSKAPRSLQQILNSCRSISLKKRLGCAFARRPTPTQTFRPLPAQIVLKVNRVALDSDIKNASAIN